MRVNVAITTWPRSIERFEYFCIVVNSLHRWLDPGGHELRYVCGLELQEAPFAHLLAEYCERRSIRLVENFDTPCLGTNLNNLIAACDAPYVLYVQDDFQLRKRLDLAQDIAFLEARPQFGMVRYKFNSVPWSQRLPVAGTPSDKPDVDQLIEIAHDTTNYYSDHPHLKHRDYHQQTGPFSELDSQICEQRMNHRAKEITSMRRGRIAGRGNGREYFLHIGVVSAMPEKWAAFKN